MAWKCLKSKQKTGKIHLQHHPTPTTTDSRSLGSFRQLPSPQCLRQHAAAAQAHGGGVVFPGGCSTWGEKPRRSRRKWWFYPGKVGCKKHMYAAKIKSWTNESVDFTGLTNMCKHLDVEYNKSEDFRDLWMIRVMKTGVQSTHQELFAELKPSKKTSAPNDLSYEARRLWLKMIVTTPANLRCMRIRFHRAREVPLKKHKDGKYLSTCKTGKR